MSSTTTPVSHPRSPSTRHSYSAQMDRDRPHRSQSTTTRSTAPASPRRSLSTSQTQPTHSRTPSTNLQNVAQYDFEQTNVARPSSGTRRGDPREGNSNSNTVTRGETFRQVPGHGRTPSRYNSEQPVPATSTSNGAHAQEARSPTAPLTLRRRTTIDSETGHWDLGKTIGAGSMGKVKLARNRDTGEQVAVKIVPRQSTEGEHRTQAERERADHSKEIRTAREAAIVTLADHPYICGMRDVLRTNYHWYMLFEYVNGGQMLDYIISHGRLKEKQARKFGRQIASALDYCHRNSIVHRDLKIENILISKNGDIKIIDFGLSNLFSPRNHLKTFCGSLYFAAPELLQAKQYTGPEVDIWSFGIVLYVLVCGKVPFDDQSMPQLHAKIKRGNVEYPPWLSPECRGLIARMLNTNPHERATLHEIMNHPWMIKGFNGPPENYLPARKPIQLPLDPAVIDKMTGFNFGSAEVITADLTRLIESEDYQRAVRIAERRNTQQTPEFERKRGVFDFYKRRNSTTSRDTLNTPSSEAIQSGQDPLNAFAPLISVYHLVVEKQEREARENNPGAIVMPSMGGEKIVKAPPDLPQPEAAYTNSQTYEMAGEKPTGGRSRPRARTQGEDEVVEGLHDSHTSTAQSAAKPTIVEPTIESSLATSGSRKENAATSLLRRLSTRRHRDLVERSERLSHPPTALSAYSPGDGGNKRSFTMRRARDDDGGASSSRPESAETQGQSILLSPPSAVDSQSDRSRKSHGLGRSVSVNSSDVKRRFARRGISEGSSLRQSGRHQDDQDDTQEGGSSHGDGITGIASDVESSTRIRSGNLAARTRSVGHSRKASMQARRGLRSEHATTSGVPEETDQEMQDEMEGGDSRRAGSTEFKPVYLKGVFSVSTTSSKPLTFIRADIIRVLQQLSVEYVDIKGGFRCRHSPSILTPGEELAVSGAQSDLPHRRKISFGAFGGRSHTERDSLRAQQTPGSRAKQSEMQSEEDSDDEPSQEERIMRSRMSTQAGNTAGETSTHVQADLGANLALRFEIFIVKVPLLSLHGIQFKKVEGGTWQYKNMAQTILKELRL